MAEMGDELDLDEMEGEDGEGEGGKKKKGGKMKYIIIAVVVLVLGGGGGGAWYMGWVQAALGLDTGAKEATLNLGAPVAHPLPVIKADLKTGRCRAPFLRTEVVVQLSSNDLELLQSKEMEVLDAVRIHLRDQERQDLVGKAGANQLRFDLVNIINQVLTPAKVHTVLFKEFLLQ